MKQNKQTWAAQRGSRVRWVDGRSSGLGVVKAVIVPERMGQPGRYLIKRNDGVEQEFAHHNISLVQ